MGKVIQIKDLCKTYGETEDTCVRALRDVNLDISHSEFVAIMGPSGSGKTTFMNIVGFLDTPTSGSYVIDGIEGSHLSPDQQAEIRNQKIGFVFQGFNLLQRTSAIENVMLPLYYRGHMDSRAMHKKAEEMLTLVGLGSRLHHQPNELSGGQQQRVAIARALVNDPAIILADEPTGNLDTKMTNDIMNLFTRLNSELGITILIVTHEPEVAGFTKRKVVFKDGIVIEDVKVKRGKSRGYTKELYK